LIPRRIGEKTTVVAPNRYAPAAKFRAELRSFLRRSERAAREAGVTPSQHLLLLQIAGSEDGETTISSLVEKLALTQSAVTELVQRAEAAGLVTRKGSQADGRVVYLSLTPEGEQKLARVHESLGPERVHLRRIVDSIDDDGG
jgi:DNA-binding MarR family transcriptional regulator